MQAMAAALPQLRALHFILPAATDNFAIPEEAEEQRRYLQAWLDAVSGFTQLQQLKLTVSTVVYRTVPSNPQPPALQEDILRALSKLQQLRQLTLQGWVWEVSPLLVAGLATGLPQLSSIWLEGCGGYGQEAEARKAEVEQRMRRVAAGLRPGLQLQYMK
jgi:hypothetical protein